LNSFEELEAKSLFQKEATDLRVLAKKLPLAKLFVIRNIEFAVKLN
jgi:hypothetical protein